MVFVARFQEASDSLILDNILGIVKDDFPGALVFYYPLIAAGSPLLDDSAARPVGTTVLHMDGFTVKPEPGDLFTIAGDTQVYEVVSSSALVGTDSNVTFLPGLRVAIPAVDGNEVVSFTGQLDFAQRTLGEFTTMAWPTFAISPKSNAPIESDDGSWIGAALKADILIGVQSPDAPTVTRKAMKYVRALKSVLRSASTARYTAGLTATFALVPDVSYEYGFIGSNAQGWEKIVKLELLLKFNER